MSKVKYGLAWDDSYEDWQIELKLYQFPHIAVKGHKLQPYQHFIKACQMIWGENNPTAQFVWHPWAVDMAMQACQSQELGLCGPSSCGKSEFSAVWLLGNLLADPAHTLAYATSTTLEAAKDKIWGSVVRYFGAIDPSIRGCLTLVNNPSPQIYVEFNNARVSSAGIKLVACSSAQGREAVNKLQGAKANSAPNALSVRDEGHSRLILMADELSDLTHAIISAMDNLKSNTWYSFVAASNPRNKLDPFSVFVKPLDGWDSINIETSIWKTKRGGVCLHFDDVKSPNLVGYKEYLVEIQNGKHQDEHGETIPYRRKWPIKGGDKIHHEMMTADVMSPLYWRNSRGYWSPMGTEITIYTDEDITASGSEGEFDNWLLSRPKVRAMGVDSAYTSGGDLTIAVIGDMGWDAKRRCQVVDIVAIEEITTNAGEKGKTHTEQVGEKIKALAQKYQVAFSDIGFDSTNQSAADYLAASLGSNEFYRCNFAGGASEIPVSDLDPTPAKDKYGNRVTELWFFGKELLRHRQLYGITEELASELIIRLYTTTKSSNLVKLMAETKRDMKKRTGGSSPDRSDAMAILLDVYRNRHGLRTMKTKLDNQASAAPGAWLEFCKTKNAARSGRRISLRQR